MPTIKVPRAFYVKERQQVYTNWRQAFWRELLQNSVDAGAQRIEVNLQEKVVNEKYATTVSFLDDGPGMTRDVLERVYMTLGASEKGSWAAGGFGRARILTCFSHPQPDVSPGLAGEGEGGDI